MTDAELGEIDEHRMPEGKPHVCVVKVALSNRIVGSPSDTMMKSRIAATALNYAMAHRGSGAGACSTTIADRSSARGETD